MKKIIAIVALGVALLAIVVTATGCSHGSGYHRQHIQACTYVGHHIRVRVCS
jgi:hypothetical protein